MVPMGKQEKEVCSLGGDEAFAIKALLFHSERVAT